MRFEVECRGVEYTQEFARRLGTLLKAGDLLVLTGELGAGKTTFTQGLGEGMGVRAGIISPTFVLARRHPSLGGGPHLVHVDAYRLGSPEEVDDLDLESELQDSVLVVEWGSGKVEHLSDSRLEVTIDRGQGQVDVGPGNDDGDDDAESSEPPRRIVVQAVGPRWEHMDLAGAMEEQADYLLGQAVLEKGNHSYPADEVRNILEF